MGAALRAISLNTWKCDGAYRERVRWMADGLVALAPDVVFLQEAFACAAPEAAADTAGDLANALGFQAEVLTSRVKSRRFEGADRQSASNLAILTKAPLRRVRRHHLPPCPGDDDRWILSGELTWTGRPVALSNTHFTHVRTAAGDRARAAQAQELAKQGAPPPGGIAILGGDLNARWEDPALALLRALKDRLVPEQYAVTRTLQGERLDTTKSDVIIDHLLVRRSLEAPDVIHKASWSALDKPSDSARRYPSDHAALVIDLQTVG